jgi:hypothetical protein
MRFSAPLLALFALLLGAAGDLAAQEPRTSPANDYLALIERAAEHEVRALESPVPYQFHERLTWIWGSETRSVIETPEGRADRIIYFGDEPLQPDQQQKQQHRLEKLLRDRDAVKDDLREQKAETQRRIRMIKAFPQAVIFNYVGREDGLLLFTFRPNPEFSPKDRETQLYRGMEGSVWFEPVQERIVRVEGRLVKDLSFGWGIAGRINKGGTYQIAQTEVTPGVWRITTLNVDVKGRMFLFSGFRFFRKEKNTAFHPTSESLDYREAVQRLLSMAVPLPGKGRDVPNPEVPRRNSLRIPERSTTIKPRLL